jgi:hypothetical protein
MALVQAWIFTFSSSLRKDNGRDIQIRTLYPSLAARTCYCKRLPRQRPCLDYSDYVEHSKDQVEFGDIVRQALEELSLVESDLFIILS